MRVATLEAHIEGMRAPLGVGPYKEDPRCPYEPESAEADAWTLGFREAVEARK
jgi:hypothetical protein